MERGSFPTVLEPEDVETGHPWAQASLRIASEEMTADAITELLGMKPTTKRLSEGEPSFTVWALDSGLDPSAPLEDHLYFLAERLADHHDGLAEVVSRANVEIWLSYSRGNGAPGAVFGHQLLAEIGSLGIDLVLDPYPSDRRTRTSTRTT